MIYPNPSSDHISISHCFEIRDIKVVDLIGDDLVSVISVSPSAFGSSIDIIAIPHGVYILVLNDNDKLLLIKE